MRYLTLPALFFTAFFFLILLLLPSQPFDDPGAFWHVRVGEWIIEHRELPRTDPFTFSCADRAWIPQQWLAELAMAMLSRLGGLDALLTALAALMAGLGAWIASRFLATGWHPLPAFLIVTGGLATCTFHLYARPHIVTLVFMGIFAGRIVEMERHGFRKREWDILFLLGILWTNLHGGIVGGIASIIFAFAGWTIWKILRKESPIISKYDLDQYFGRCCLLACATLVNPFGLQLHRVWFSLIDSPTLREVVSEHRPLDPFRPDGQAILAFGFVYLAALLGTLPKCPRVAWLLPLVWFAFACQSIRHGPIFSVVALVTMADLLPETFWFRWLKAHGETMIREPRGQTLHRKRSLVLPAVLVLACLGLQAAKIPMPVVGSGWARLNPETIPLEMAGPLERYAASRPVGTPIFNDANLGGFVLHVAPSLKIFMDDRCELYGDEWLRNYMDAMTEHPERFDEWAKKWPFELAIVTTAPGFKLNAYLAKHPGWREVARCRLAVIYERK